MLADDLLEIHKRVNHEVMERLPDAKAVGGQLYVAATVKLCELIGLGAEEHKELTDFAKSRVGPVLSPAIELESGARSLIGDEAFEELNPGYPGIAALAYADAFVAGVIWAREYAG